MSKRKDVKRIKASTALQQKVGMGEIDDKKIQEAQQVIESNDVDFLPIAQPLLTRLGDMVKQARGAANQRDRDVVGAAITTVIMNLKANAATFNYHTVSDIAGIVMNFLDEVKTMDDEIITIVDNLQRAVTVVISQKMTGKDNPAGVPLVKEFRDVCKRYMEKRMQGG